MKDLLLSLPSSYLAGAILIIAVVGVMAIKAGYLRLHIKGIDIERPSKGNEPHKNTPPLTENREILYKLVRFAEDYMAWCKQEIAASIKREYGSVNSVFVALVCEKIFDRALIWIILNHIEDTDKYKDRKIEETYKVMSAMAYELVPERAEKKEYMQLLMNISKKFVVEFIKQVCEFKAEEGIERNEKQRL